MNRRELLREMSRVQATWVNRHASGTGDVNIAVEDEQDYLTRIAAVFERAREDVRRKRRPAAAAAQAAISAILLAYDPQQPRDRKGRWSDREGDGPSAPSTSRGGKTVPVAKPRPKPEPAKVMTPEAALGAAPKDVEAETGSRKVDKAGTAALERRTSPDCGSWSAPRTRATVGPPVRPSPPPHYP